MSAPSGEPAGLGTDALARDFEPVDRLELGLADFGEADAIAYLVVLEHDGAIRLDIDSRLRTDPGAGVGQAALREPGRDVCLYASLGHKQEAKIAFTLGGSAQARIEGQDIHAAWAPEKQSHAASMQQSVVVSAMQPVTVVVALRDAAQFHAAGDSLAIAVDAGEPLHIQRLPEPGFHCVTRPADLEGGSYTDVGLYREARDMHVDWRIKAHAYAFLWSSSSLGTYDVQLRQGHDIELETKHEEIGGHAYGYQGTTLGPGDYRFALHALKGITSSMWMTFAVGFAIEEPVVHS